MVEIGRISCHLVYIFADCLFLYFSTVSIMFASLSKNGISKSYAFAKTLSPSLKQMIWKTPTVSMFGRRLGSRSKEQLYIPFETDFDREHASIMFWVTKNTNLKEVNVNIRVCWIWNCGLMW